MVYNPLPTKTFFTIAVKVLKLVPSLFKAIESLLKVQQGKSTTLLLLVSVA